ncbi:MAG: DUF2207 domain-containing protein [Ruminococcaceae bacterium]|nr:DUF2207 domain-containing protein [Oscillospiraceae bacterium]
MKKTFTALLIAAVCVLFFVSPVSAANRVPEMEIEVALRPDGSAYVTQTWHAQTDEGTEFYLARNDSGYLSITDFSVSDKDGRYTFVENWDVGASFEEKANKCGIVETKDGVELCWGISEYGENRYAIEYVVHGLAGAYSDADGFNHRFVDDMSVFPSDVVLTVCNQDGTPLTDEECDVWGFGFDGQVAFEDGVIRAWSEEPLKSGQHATLMLSMKKGLLAPERTAEGSFEEVKARAMEGSDYDYDGPSEEDVELTLDDYLFALVFFGGGAWAIVGFFKWLFGMGKRKAAKRLKQVDYFRDVPNDGNLNVTYHLGLSDRVCQEDTLMGAYLLRLIADGALEPVEQDDRSNKVSLRLARAPRTGNEFDDVLYTVLEAAAGADGTLQPDELQYYCMRNRRPLIAFVDSCKSDAQRTMYNGGWLKGTQCRSRRDLTQPGLEQLDQIWGLKRFLLDFSLIHERGVGETVIWQDYMVYAMLLGIADKVAPQIKQLYPEAAPQIERYERNITYAASYNRALTFAYVTRVQQKRSRGSGGRISMGGGGGFSGGGRGGTR